MIKDLMVHLDGGGEDAIRLAHAENLSALFDEARITGLYTNPLPEYAYVMGAQSGFGDIGPVIELEQQLRREGDRIVERLTARLSRPGAAHEVRRIDAWPSAIPDLAVSQARCADLFIATAPYRDEETRAWDHLVEALIFESGHALLLVPPQFPTRSALESVLVAWSDTAPAARAVSESLPFLKRASKVSLLSIEAPTNEDQGFRAVDLAAHLDRHGVRVELVTARGDDAEVGAIIRKEAAKAAADMIVMGAYGHSRFREWILGGATRDVAELATIPFLLAH